MVTAVGNESALNGLIEDLLLLSHDAIAAYDETISRLSYPKWKQQVSAFRSGPRPACAGLTRWAQTIGANVPKGGDTKQMLITGKVALAGMMGDRTILTAMRTNEEDAVTAYDRASRHQEATADARQIFERAHSDEVRRRDWMAQHSRA